MSKELFGKALAGILFGAMARAIKEVEEETEAGLVNREIEMFGRELTESERASLLQLIKIDNEHGTNQANIFAESIKYSVAQSKAVQAEQLAADTDGDDDQFGGLPKEVLNEISERLGVPLSAMRVIRGEDAEINLSDIFDLGESCGNCPSCRGENKEALAAKLKEHEAEAQRIRDLLNS